MKSNKNIHFILFSSFLTRFQTDFILKLDHLASFIYLILQNTEYYYSSDFINLIIPMLTKFIWRFVSIA